jgi:hypothetical protein
VSSVILLLFIIIMAFTATSLIMAKGYQQHQQQLENTQVKLKEANDRNLALIQQALLTHTLDLWHQGHLADAKILSKRFPPGSLEALACEALFNPILLEQADNQIMQTIKERDCLLHDFIWGEIYQKQGSAQDALDHYKRFIATKPQEGRHDLLRLRVGRRIQELSGNKQ